MWVPGKAVKKINSSSFQRWGSRGRTITLATCGKKRLASQQEVFLQVSPPQKERVEQGEWDEWWCKKKKKKNYLIPLQARTTLGSHFNVLVKFRKATVEFYMYIPHCCNLHCHFPECSQSPKHFKWLQYPDNVLVPGEALFLLSYQGTNL